MVMLEDYGISDEKGYANLSEINKAIGTYVNIPWLFCITHTVPVYMYTRSCVLFGYREGIRGLIYEIMHVIHYSGLCIG